jgi:hypothetical protein
VKSLYFTDIATWIYYNIYIFVNVEHGDLEDVALGDFSSQ